MAPGDPQIIALAMETQIFPPLLLRVKLLPSGKIYFCVIQVFLGSFSVWIAGGKNYNQL